MTDCAQPTLKTAVPRVVPAVCPAGAGGSPDRPAPAARPTGVPDSTTRPGTRPVHGGGAATRASRAVVPGPERCLVLRALGAVRDGAVSLVATTALVLGAAWLLRRI